MSKILMVDDEQHMDILIKQKFRKEIKAGDYDFLFARNGLEALKTIENNEDVSLVISDLNMPEMDGLTLLERLEHLNPKIRTIIASAYNDLDTVKAALDRGATDFITKPIDLNDLSDTIGRTLDQNAPERLEKLKAQASQISLKDELKIASQLQKSILPTHFPDKHEVQLHATMRAALDVGGDFYDYFWVSPSELGVVIADVSGKGISAALFMGMARTTIKMTAATASNPSECLNIVNQQLAEDNQTAMFVTLFYGILDITTGLFTYANGGHCPPIVLKNTGWEPLDIPNGPALGVIDEITFAQKSTQLEPGNSLFLYTDGITEAMNKNDVAFSEKRLFRSLDRHKEKNMTDLIEEVVSDVSIFVDAYPQSDDITCLAFRYRPHG